MKKKIQATIISTVAPTTNETVANGYALGQWWQNTTTGLKYYHKNDGVWEPLQQQDLTGLVSKTTKIELHSGFLSDNDPRNKKIQVNYSTATKKITLSRSDGTFQGYWLGEPIVGLTNGGKLHLIDWTTVDTEASTKEAFAIELGTDYFFDREQELHT